MNIIFYPNEESNQQKTKRFYFLSTTINRVTLPLHEMEIDVARCSVFYRAYMDAVMARVNATPTTCRGKRPSKGGAM